MKILIINSNAIFKKNKGLFVYRATGEFLIRLKNLGNSIEFFHFRLELQNHDFLANFNLLTKDLKISTIKRNKSKLISYVKAFIIGAYRIVKNDFLYLFYPNSFYPLCFFAITINKPFGLYVRGEKGIESKVSKFLFKKAKFITTVSPKLSKTINAHGGSAMTIRPMMDYSIADIIIERNYDNKTFFKFLFVGRVEIDKGIFELIHSIKELVLLEHKNFCLDIVGEGPHFMEAKKEVDSLGLKKYINFHGSVYDKSELLSFYRNSDVFILPTYHEGFPRVLYEAMLFGTPIITTFVGSISFVMRDHYNCYEVKPKSTSDITKLLDNFINNYVKMSIVAKGGTKTILDYLKKYNLSHEEIINSNL